MAKGGWWGRAWCVMVGWTFRRDDGLGTRMNLADELWLWLWLRGRDRDRDRENKWMMTRGRGKLSTQRGFASLPACSLHVAAWLDDVDR